MIAYGNEDLKSSRIAVLDEGIGKWVLNGFGGRKPLLTRSMSDVIVSITLTTVLKPFSISYPFCETVPSQKN